MGCDGRSPNVEFDCKIQHDDYLDYDDGGGDDDHGGGGGGVIQGRRK